MAYQITCINKTPYHLDPYTAIRGLGWRNDVTGETGWSTREAMYDFVIGGGVAYVSKGAFKAYLIAEKTAAGTKYVKTKPDHTRVDNLLSLMECVGK